MTSAKQASLPFPVKLQWRSQHWRDCYLSFLLSKYQKTRSYDTVYQHHRRLMTFFVDQRAPDKYTQQEVRDWLDTPMRKEKVSPVTRNLRLASLSLFYKYASSVFQVKLHGKTTYLLREPPPTAGIEKISFAESERELDTDDMRKIFSVIDRSTLQGKRDYALLLFLFLSGRRRKEVILLWKDLEMLPDGRWMYSFRAKGRVTRERALMPVLAMNAIQDYLEADGRWGSMNPDDGVFVGVQQVNGKKSVKPIGRERISSIFHGYAQKANVTLATAHCLRRRAAQERLKANGGNLEEVREHFGWSTTEMARKYATSRKPKELAADPIGAQIEALFADL